MHADLVDRDGKMDINEILSMTVGYPGGSVAIIVVACKQDELYIKDCETTNDHATNFRNDTKGSHLHSLYDDWAIQSLFLALESKE